MANPHPSKVPVPTVIRLRTGAQNSKLNHHEPNPPPAPVPKPHPDLDAQARKEWLHIAPQLHRLGLLTPIDVAAFFTYCSALSRRKTATRLLDRARAADPVYEGMVKVNPSSGVAHINPLVKLLRDAETDVLKFGAQFGLSPSGRAKLTGNDLSGDDVAAKYFNAPESA